MANQEEAPKEYVALCKLGGSRSFTELVAAAALHNPFDDGMISAIVKPIRSWLDAVDDSGL